MLAQMLTACIIWSYLKILNKKLSLKLTQYFLQLQGQADLRKVTLTQKLRRELEGGAEEITQLLEIVLASQILEQ